MGPLVDASATRELYVHDRLTGASGREASTRLLGVYKVSSPKCPFSDSGTLSSRGRRGSGQPPDVDLGQLTGRHGGDAHRRGPLAEAAGLDREFVMPQFVRP
jgi:hypothetical protein